MATAEWKQKSSTSSREAASPKAASSEPRSREGRAWQYSVTAAGL